MSYMSKVSQRGLNVREQDLKPAVHEGPDKRRQIGAPITDSLQLALPLPVAGLLMRDHLQLEVNRQQGVSLHQ